MAPEARRSRWCCSDAEVEVLPTETVHLWLLNSDRFTSLLGAHLLPTLLDEGERARSARYRGEARRREFLAARSALRVVGARYLGQDPAHVRLDCGPFGKPRITDTDLSVNLSHSGGWILIAVARGAEVGVDMQVSDARLQASAVADLLFSRRERVAWDADPPSRRQDVLLRTWTRKEAFVKALGYGFTYPIDQLELSPAILGQDPVEAYWHTDLLSGRRSCWTFGNLAMPDVAGAEAALVVEARTWPTLVLRRLDECPTVA